MIKRLLVSSALAAVALGAVAVRSYGQESPSAPTCYDLDDNDVVFDLSYDTRAGVSIDFLAGGRYATGTLPLTVGDDPNPHFDRIYALLMKGIDSNRVQRVCLESDQEPSSPIVSIELRHVSSPRPPELQKVQVCDSLSRCSYLDSGRLPVRSTN